MKNQLLKFFKLAAVVAILVTGAVKFAQASCNNVGDGNNGHCRSDGDTGSCVDSYWFESDNCKEPPKQV
jgi:hypothetical protein